MFSRLDLVFFAGMAGLWIVFRGQALRYYLPLDIVAIIFSVLSAFTTKFGFPEYFEHTNAAMTMVGVALFIRLPAAYFLGLHQNPSADKPLKTLAKLAAFALVSSAAISVVMLVVARVMDFDAMPRTVLAMDAVFSFLFIGATRFLHRDLHTASSQPKMDTPIGALQTNWKQWLIEGSTYYGIVVGLLGVYMLWSKLAFGTFSPVSGQIKRWWGSFLVSFYGKHPQDTLTFFGVNTKGDSAAWQPISEIFGKWAAKLTFLNPDGNTRYVIVIVAAALVFYLILRTDKQKARTVIARLGILPLFTGCFLQVISSSIKQIVAWSIVAVMGLSSSLSFWDVIKTDMPHRRWQEDAVFVDTIPILEANTEPGSIIGLTGGGNTGYFIHDRTIVNMDGLINSQPYFESLKDRTAGAYLESMGLDYVFANKYILESQPYKGMFNAYLTDTGIDELGGNALMKYGRAQ